MLTTVLDKSSFDSIEAAILLKAYSLSASVVEASCKLDVSAQAKLSKIILALGNQRVRNGGELTSGVDAESVAAIASERFIRLLAPERVHPIS
jgi:hypothetical protein